MEEASMGVEEIKSEKINTNDLQNYCDTIVRNFDTKLDYTIDFFDTNLGVLLSKESPSCAEFCVAAFQEILSCLKPGHEMWDKVKYMAFILNLATRNIDFSVLYNIYHQTEQQVAARNLEWRDDTVKELFNHQIVDNLIVKFDLSKMPDDPEDSKSGYDCDEVPVSSDDFIMNGPSIQCFEEKFTASPVKSKRKHKKRKKKDILGDTDSLKVKDEDKFEVTNTNGVFVEEADDDVHKDADFIFKDTGPLDVESNNLDKDTDHLEAKKKKRGIKHRAKDKAPTVSQRKSKHLNCQLCDFRGKYKSDLDKHAFSVHNTTRLCTQCGHISKTFEEWKLHEKSHTVTCEICKQKFLGKMSHMLHMAAVHKSSDDEKVPCDVCGTFLKPQSLKMHIFQVHGTQAYKCDLCEHTSSTKQLLAKHRKWHFRKMSKCPECGKMVKFLESHFKRQCSSSKPKERFNCELCDKTFSFKQGMTRHIKNVHQKISNFHCEICNYQTHYGYNFRVHMTTKHSKESFFKFCSICSKKTGNLELHMKNYHFDEYMQAAKTEVAMTGQEQEERMF